MKREIIDDIKRVALRLGLKPRDGLSKFDYLNNGAKYSDYQIWADGTTWSDYCKIAG